MLLTRKNMAAAILFLLGALHLNVPEAGAVGSVREEMASATQRMRQGAYTSALEPLQSAVSAYPHEPVLHTLLVECHFGAAMEQLHQRKFTEAATLLLTAQELAPQQSRFWHYRGLALMLAGDLPGAESELELALIKGHEPVETLLLLARLHYQRGELERARQRVNEALDNSPDNAELSTFRSQIERELVVDARMRPRSGGNFTVSSEGEVNGELGREVLDLLEQAYNETGNLFSLYPDVQVPVILYGRKDFLEVTGAPAWSGGLYDGKIRVPVGGLQAMTPELAGVLYHEYAHVLIAHKGGRRVPVWLNEGLAQVAQALVAPPEPELHPGARFLPFARLESSFSGLSKDEVVQAYAQSYAFVRFLGVRCGWEQVSGSLEKIGAGMRLDKAFNSSTGSCTETLEVLEALWREHDPAGEF